jgi:hypothetical protein
MFLLLFIAILGGTWGAQRAHADTVSDFTEPGAPILSSFSANYESIGPVVFYEFGAGLKPIFTSNPVTAAETRVRTE